MERPKIEEGKKTVLRLIIESDISTEDKITQIFRYHKSWAESNQITDEEIEKEAKSHSGQPAWVMGFIQGAKWLKSKL